MCLSKDVSEQEKVKPFEQIKPVVKEKEKEKEKEETKQDLL